MSSLKAFTPDQVAEILQLNTNTIYELINRGEIVAKRLGKVYRIPASSISFVLTGLDKDIYSAQQKDLANIEKINIAIKEIRQND